MSLQECQIALCSPNQLEMTIYSPALATEQRLIPHHTGRLAWLPLGTPEIPSDTRLSLSEHQFQLRNSRKAPCTPYRLEEG